MRVECLFQRNKTHHDWLGKRPWSLKHTGGYRAGPLFCDWDENRIVPPGSWIHWWASLCSNMVFGVDNLWLAKKSNNRASNPPRDSKKTDTPTWRHREVSLSFISVNSNKLQLKLQVIPHQPTPAQSGVAQCGQVPAPLKDLGCRKPCRVWRQAQLSPAGTSEPPAQTQSPSPNELTFNVHIARVLVQGTWPQVL